MDLKKLSLGDQIIGGSGIVLLIASFLPWFKVDLGPFGDASANGWDVGFFWCILPVLIGIAMVAVVAIRAFSPQTKLPDLPLPWDQALFIAGCVAAAIVVLKLLIGDSPLDRGFGLFLAALASIGLAAGGYVKWKMDPAKSSGPPTTF